MPNPAAAPRAPLTPPDVLRAALAAFAPTAALEALLDRMESGA